MCSKLFANEKQQKLSSIDNSRKGSVDEYIVDLVSYINVQAEYCTTSSCSGRIVILQQPEDAVQQVKKGCKWLLVSHDHISIKDIFGSLENHEHSTVLKFEPFIIHINCASLEAARHMHCISVASGFRNSGITIGNSGKIMVAVRSTLGLETPFSSEGKLLVSEQYMEYIVKKANDKMIENQRRIDRFYSNLQSKPFQPMKKSLKKIHLSKPEYQSEVKSEKEKTTSEENTIKDYELDGITELLS